MSSVVRLAVEADAEPLAKLAEAFHAEHGDPTGYLTAEAIRRDGFGDDPEFRVLVAEGPDGLIGYALFHDAYEPAYAARGIYMADLYVWPPARGLGLGRRLIAAVAEHARRHGRSYVWWVARASNTPAHGFYRTLASLELDTKAFGVTLEEFEALAEEHAGQQPGEYAGRPRA